MDFSYENGVFVASFIFIYSIIALIVQLNSQMERNLNKVGLRRSWMTRQPKPLEQKYIDRPFYRKILKFLFFIIFQLASVLLSWLGVLLTACMMAYAWSKDYGTPSEVKAFRWKMRNRDMPFEDIVKEMEIMAGNDLSGLGAAIEDVKSSMRECGLKV